MPRERRSRPTAPGNGVKNGPRARQNPLRGEEFFPGAKPIEALGAAVIDRSELFALPRACALSRVSVLQ